MSLQRPDRKTAKVGQVLLYASSAHVFRVVVEEIPTKRFGLWKTKRLSNGELVARRFDDFYTFDDKDTDILVEMENAQTDALAKVKRAHDAFLEVKKVYDAADEVWGEAEQELEAVKTAAFDKVLEMARAKRAKA